MLNRIGPITNAPTPGNKTNGKKKVGSKKNDSGKGDSNKSNQYKGSSELPKKQNWRPKKKDSTPLTVITEAPKEKEQENDQPFSQKS
jgi:hypothetical protein